MADSVRTLAIRSSIVNFVLSFGLKGLMLFQAILFARTFAPGELGQLATVILVVSFAQLLTKVGVDESIIRETEDPQAVMDTAFSIALGLGVALFGTLYLGAPLLAAIFGRPELASFFRVLSFMVFGTSLSLPTDLWIRTFRLGMAKAPAYADFAVTTAAVLLFHYVGGLGVWSLFWGRLCGFAAQVGTVLVLAPSLPRPRLDRTQATRILAFGWPILVSGLANYLMHRGDDLVVRFFWGDTALAYYQLAYAFPYYLQEGTDALLGALLPMFSQLRGSRERVIAAFLRTDRYVSISIVPCGILLAAIAQPLVLVVYGEKWRPAIQPMTFLALAFTVQVMWGYGWGALCMAWGKTHYLMIVKLWIVLFLATVGVLLIRAYGPLGGAIHMLAQAVLTVTVVRRWILRHEAGSLHFLRNSGRAILAGLLVGLPIRFLVAPHVTTLPVLIGVVIAFFALYAALVFALDRPLVAEVREIVVESLRRRGAEA